MLSRLFAAALLVPTLAAPTAHRSRAATTTINRLDYGVKWNRAVEGGGVMLGDEVKIEINVEGGSREELSDIRCHP